MPTNDNSTPLSEEQCKQIAAAIPDLHDKVVADLCREVETLDKRVKKLEDFIDWITDFWADPPTLLQ